ncbi:ribosomal-protein-alanine N-acetyltransferase [Polystyrenella longa]|uniref:Ribosomal-protein-alanine N-acetyltransferase n=1 Tax=Polystyrenella longa TaxID=2528007 RepID=A0A518CPV7_9PLAN|nr:N-acetyltransferase [Polystyrenella longa]QDU81253.1 ribosomal-protein-alanine N-acetyltransferase [Polystyrenella longa]
MSKIAPSQTLTLRAARINDLDDLLQIESESFSTESYPLTSRRQFRYLLTKAKNVELFVACLDKNVVGYGLLFFRKNSFWGRLYSISVRPEYQGGAVGKQLFERAEQRIRKRKQKGMLLEIRADNQKHLKRYLGLGYQLIDTIPDYYPDGSAALKLRKEL